MSGVSTAFHLVWTTPTCLVLVVDHALYLRKCRRSSCHPAMSARSRRGRTVVGASAELAQAPQSRHAHAQTVCRGSWRRRRSHEDVDRTKRRPPARSPFSRSVRSVSPWPRFRHDREYVSNANGFPGIRLAAAEVQRNAIRESGARDREPLADAGHHARLGSRISASGAFAIGSQAVPEVSGYLSVERVRAPGRDPSVTPVTRGHRKRQPVP
jgi:hypothetical protein